MAGVGGSIPPVPTSEGIPLVILEFAERQYGNVWVRDQSFEWNATAPVETNPEAPNCMKMRLERGRGSIRVPEA